MFTLSERNIDSFALFRHIKTCLSNGIKLFLFAICFLAGLSDLVFAMAGQPGGGEGQPQGPGALLAGPLPMMIVIFAIFYFLLIRPQSKKAKEHKQMLENLKKGDKVMTNGGIFGVIEDMDGETITLKIGIGSDVKIRVNRGHIAAIRGKE
jgi:preprotein translocase subunit YajC